MTAAEFKAKARKAANRAGMSGATIWAFGEDEKHPDLAGIRHGGLELTMRRPAPPVKDGDAYRMIIACVR